MAASASGSTFPYAELPFQYQDPLNMFVYWICDVDEDNKLVSVFINDEHERQTFSAYMTEAEALEQRRLLRASHWQPMRKPQVTIEMPDDMKDSILLPGERIPKKGETTRQRLRKKMKGKEKIEAPSTK